LNQSIKPTISTSYEIGTEFRMFDNRFWGDINLYQTRHEEPDCKCYQYAPAIRLCILNKSMPVLYVTKVLKSAQDSLHVKTKDIQWDLEGNISKNKNKLVKRLTAQVKDDSLLEGNSFSASSGMKNQS
jgi:hypothetical protein